MTDLYEQQSTANVFIGKMAESKSNLIHGIVNKMGLPLAILTNLAGGGMVRRYPVPDSAIVDDQRIVAAANRLALDSRKGWKLWDFKGDPTGEVEVVWTTQGKRLTPVLHWNVEARVAGRVPAGAIRWECTGTSDVVLWRRVRRKKKKHK